MSTKVLNGLDLNGKKASNGARGTVNTDLVTLSQLLSGGVDLDGWPIYAYGDSYLLITTQSYYTSGQHTLHLVKNLVNAGTLTSYAVGGTFIIDVVGGLMNGAAVTGSTGQAAGATWPGVSSRDGLLVLDTTTNDIVHSIGGVYAPWIISDVDTYYVDGLKGMYRATLALMSSESRIEAESATLTGTWTSISSAAYSSGTLRRSTVNGSKAAFTVTPPQTGIFAGKVFLHLAKVSVSVGSMSKIKIDIDGANAQYYTPNNWENGLSTGECFDCISVEVPADNASHTVNVTHVGSAGQNLYVDCITIPSIVPNPIVVMGGEHPIKVATGVWDSSQITMYRRNILKVLPVLKAVVGEFGNAIYVRSPLTPNGIYSADGIHPNDRGQQQRAIALVDALSYMRPWLEARRLSALSDGNFGVV